MSENPMPSVPSKADQVSKFNTEKLISMSAIAFASLGAFLNFVGVCILQSNMNKALKPALSSLGVAGSILGTRSAHLYDAQWFHTFFYIAVIIAFAVLSLMGRMTDNRLTMMAFLAIGFVYLTGDMNGYIDGARSESDLTGNSNLTVGGPATAFTGCLLMTLSWFAMMVETGGAPSLPFFSK